MKELARFCHFNSSNEFGTGVADTKTTNNIVQHKLLPMKKIIFIYMISLIAYSHESQGQYIIAGVVSPGSYYYKFDPEIKQIAHNHHLGFNIPPVTLDLNIAQHGSFVLRFHSQASGGASGGAEATVQSFVGVSGFIAHRDSSLPINPPGITTYSYLYVVDTLDLGDTINARQNYLYQTQNCFYAATYGYTFDPRNSDWVNIGDHYLGFTLIRPMDTLYGWVRINVTVINSEAYTTTIKDYALNDNPWIGIGDSPAEKGFSLFLLALI